MLKTARFLVLIPAGGSVVAKLFDTERLPLAEFDAASEEVAVMTDGLLPAAGLGGADWDAPLRGHSESERADAQLYTLDV